MALRSYPFEIKAISEDTGTFTGKASVYGITDNGGDMVMPGAFSRTLSDGKQRPLLWQHGEPIGVCTLTDTPEALMLEGKLSLGVQQAKDALVLMRDGVVKGLSIGFQTVRSDMQNGVRQLKELKLWEVSVVTFPMLDVAQVTTVKSAEKHRAMLHALDGFKASILAQMEIK